jgi:acetoin utilization deacetylase AcuC-like enzyme
VIDSVKWKTSMKVFFDPQYNATGYEFETTRKAAQIAHSLSERPITNVEVISPRPADFEELTQVHCPDYVTAVITGDPEDIASSAGLRWDEQYFVSVAASSGGARDAALEALASGSFAGSLSSGLHHARYHRGSGFCAFNGLVLGAQAALDVGAQRVLILDLDAHCGGGTASLITDLDGVEQLDVSVSAFDSYAPRPDARLIMSDGNDYLNVIEHELENVNTPDSIDLVLYNAGMDPHHGSGGPRAIDTEVLALREALVFTWAKAHKLPVAWVLAGGYTWGGLDMNGLVDLHRLTIETAATAASPDRR